MNKFDEILIKNYRKIKRQIIPFLKGCPEESLLWDYARGVLKKKEREEVDGHLLACSECLETLKSIRMIQQTESSPQKVPEHLHKKAGEILRNALAEPGLRPKDRPVILKVTLLWDQIRNKITQLKPALGEMFIGPMPELQPVRNGHDDLKVKEAPSTYLYNRRIEINEGTIVLEIDRSGKNGYLILKTSFQAKTDNFPCKLSNIRAILYKSDRVCSSLYLDYKGEAMFTRIREGEYSLELLAGEKSLGMVELFIDKGEK
ncbi:MAG: zf-HC2 domain-containing protein [bacterium]